MRMRGAWMVVASVCACTRPNPLFGDGESATGDGTATSQGDGSTAASEASTTSATSADASSGTTFVSSSTSHGEEGTSGHDADMGLACTLPEPLELGIAVTQNGIDVTGPCELLDVHGVLQRENGSLTVVDCAGCDACGGNPITISTTGVALPVLPACGGVVLWGMDVDGACAWQGLAVFDEGVMEPYYILSLTQSPSAMAIPAFSVMPQVLDACPSRECPEAALLQLEFPGNGDTTIAPDDAPKPMELGFPNAASASKWFVDDLQSMVAPDCKRHVAWTATHV